MGDTLVGDTAGQTRQRMLVVAERLFAERGVSAVSLRMVGQHAGQKNNSAAQYHFGSKQGLVDAIVAWRSAPIEARRAELLAGLTDQRADVLSLVRVLVQPLAESIPADGETPHYLRFLANAMDDYALTESWRVSTVQPPSLRATVHRLHGALPRLPAQVFERRMRWVSRVSLRLLADHEHSLSTQGPGESRDQVVGDIVAMMVALLEAPHHGGSPDPE